MPTSIQPNEAGWRHRSATGHDYEKGLHNGYKLSGLPGKRACPGGGGPTSAQHDMRWAERFGKKSVQAGRAEFCLRTGPDDCRYSVEAGIVSCSNVRARKAEMNRAEPGRIVMNMSQRRIASSARGTRVLFFYIDANTSSGYSTGLGIASISGYLKQHGVETALVYYKGDNDHPHALAKAEQYAPCIFGFYSTSSGWPVVRQLSRALRARFPDTVQVYGGVHATLAPDVLVQAESLDAVCVGYGEEPMLALCRRLSAGKPLEAAPGFWVRSGSAREKISKSPPQVPMSSPEAFLHFDHRLFLNELERYDDFDRAAYPLEIIFNRGCPFGCSFCSARRLGAIVGRRRFCPPPEACIAALKRAVDDTGLATIEIHDDILTLNRRWFRAFITQYAESVRLPFICNLRAGTFDEEDARLLKAARVKTTWIGIESGNDTIRNDVLKKGLSPQTLHDAFELLHKYEIPVVTQNLIGVPRETPEQFLDTVRLNAALCPNHCYLSVYYPYPDTALYDLCVAENLIGECPESFKERTTTILRLPDFPREKIAFYLDHFNTLVRYEQMRIREPRTCPLPLTDGNSAAIVAFMQKRDRKAQGSAMRGA